MSEFRLYQCDRCLEAQTDEERFHEEDGWVEVGKVYAVTYPKIGSLPAWEGIRTMHHEHFCPQCALESLPQAFDDGWEPYFAEDEANVIKLFWGREEIAA